MGVSYIYGVLSLACTQAGIIVSVFVLPVIGSRLRFTSHPYVGEYSN